MRGNSQAIEEIRAALKNAERCRFIWNEIIQLLPNSTVNTARQRADCAGLNWSAIDRMKDNLMEAELKLMESLCLTFDSNISRSALYHLAHNSLKLGYRVTTRSERKG